MPTKTTSTPDSVADELAAAEAEHRRLADKAAAIDEAGRTTRTAVELAEYRRQFHELPEPTRDAAIAAREELEEVAAADRLDLDALVAAFDKRQRADAECGSVAMFLHHLDQIDPLPTNPNGVQRLRSVPIGRMHEGVKFSDYLNTLLLARTQATYNRRVAQLRQEMADVVDTAEQVAREQAAQLADGERLHVDTPESIADTYRRAIATITPTDVTAETERRNSGDEHAMGNRMRADKLRELLDAEVAGPNELPAAEDQDPPAE